MENIRRHKGKLRKTKYRVLEGDIYFPKDKSEKIGKFDVIIANLPIWFKASFWSNSEENYEEKFEILIKDLKRFLKSKGKAFIAWASFGEPDLITDLCIKHNINHSISFENTFGIKWSIYTLSLKNNDKIKEG